MTFLQRLTTRNVGNADRVIRAIPFAVFVWAWASGALVGLPLVILGIAATMMLFTAVTGLCSIYAMLGISTCKARAT